MITQRFKIFLVDDHSPMRASLRKLLEFEKDLEVCGEASGVEEAIQGIQSSKPNAAIVDLVLQKETGIDLLKRLKAQGLRVPVLILSMLPEALNAHTVLEHGARGYLMKSEPADSILLALRQVLDGKTYFSPAMEAKFNKGNITHE